MPQSPRSSHLSLAIFVGTHIKSPCARFERLWSLSGNLSDTKHSMIVKVAVLGVPERKKTTAMFVPKTNTFLIPICFVFVVWGSYLDYRGIFMSTGVRQEACQCWSLFAVYVRPQNTRVIRQPVWRGRWGRLRVQVPQRKRNKVDNMLPWIIFSVVLRRLDRASIV